MEKADLSAWVSMREHGSEFFPIACYYGDQADYGSNQASHGRHPPGPAIIYSLLFLPNCVIHVLSSLLRQDETSIKRTSTPTAFSFSGLAMSCENWRSML